MLTERQIDIRAKRVKEIEELENTLKKEKEKLKKELYDDFKERGQRTIETVHFKVTCYEQSSPRIDEKRIKIELPDISARYMKIVTSQQCRVTAVK